MQEVCSEIPFPITPDSSLESSGLKGYVHGGAQISELHGNFIVNTGEAKAEDVLAIVEHVKAYCVGKISGSNEYRSRNCEKARLMRFFTISLHSIRGRIGG